MINEFRQTIFLSSEEFYNLKKFHSSTLWIIDNTKNKDRSYDHEIAFVCPCDSCCTIIKIPVHNNPKEALRRGYKGTYWKISFSSDKKKVTLDPSIHIVVRKNDCGSHFWIKDSCVMWVLTFLS